MKCKFHQTKVYELESINQLIISSRSIWNYDSEYFEKSTPLIAISKKWLKSHFGFSIKSLENDLLGFLGLEAHGKTLILEHLWVSPLHMNLSVGKQAIAFTRKWAENNNFQKIVFYPDPPAEGFYLKQGAQFTSKKMPSRVQGGPLFREMSFLL